MRESGRGIYDIFAIAGNLPHLSAAASSQCCRGSKDVMNKPGQEHAVTPQPRVTLETISATSVSLLHPEPAQLVLLSDGPTFPQPCCSWSRGN